MHANGLARTGPAYMAARIRGEGVFPCNGMAPSSLVCPLTLWCRVTRRLGLPQTEKGRPWALEHTVQTNDHRQAAADKGLLLLFSARLARPVVLKASRGKRLWPVPYKGAAAAAAQPWDYAILTCLAQMCAPGVCPGSVLRLNSDHLSLGSKELTARQHTSANEQECCNPIHHISAVRAPRARLWSRLSARTIVSTVQWHVRPESPTGRTASRGSPATKRQTVACVPMECPVRRRPRTSRCGR